MLATTPTPFVRLSNLFTNRQVYVKCEHLALSFMFRLMASGPRGEDSTS